VPPDGGAERTVCGAGRSAAVPHARIATRMIMAWFNIGLGSFPLARESSVTDLRAELCLL
jgi:hypothetical protein